jgi:hypothetical protein
MWKCGRDAEEKYFYERLLREIEAEDEHLEIVNPIQSSQSIASYHFAARPTRIGFAVLKGTCD